jgi:hypothetical protein
MNKKTYRPFPQYVPTDGQKVWGVFFNRGGCGVALTWDAANSQWLADGISVNVPWFNVVEWRPRDVT